MTRTYRRRAGVAVEPVGLGWAAFSPASGETVLLNDESAAILEILEDGPATAADLCATLSSDNGLPVEHLLALVDPVWSQLLDAGLVSCEGALDATDAPP